MNDLIRPTEFKPGWIIDGQYTLLSPVGQEDLIVRETGEPAGRMSEWSECDAPPEGTEWLWNKLCNKWWVREPSGRIIAACFDALTSRNRITIP